MQWLSRGHDVRFGSITSFRAGYIDFRFTLDTGRSSASQRTVETGQQPTCVTRTGNRCLFESGSGRVEVLCHLMAEPVPPAGDLAMIAVDRANRMIWRAMAVPRCRALVLALFGTHAVAETGCHASAHHRAMFEGKM